MKSFVIVAGVELLVAAFIVFLICVVNAWTAGNALLDVMISFVYHPLGPLSFLALWVVAILWHYAHPRRA